MIEADRAKFIERLGEEIWSARYERGWTQAELSQRTGIPVKTISRIENGRYTRRPHIATIKTLVTVLEIDRSDARWWFW